jgi:hypothetical protein
MCREHTLTEAIDHHHVDSIPTMRRSIRCEGCEATVSTRVASSHLETCVKYLRRRILEGRLDRLNVTEAYETMASVNQSLRARNYQLQEQVRIMMTPYEPVSPPGPPGGLHQSHPPPHPPPLLGPYVAATPVGVGGGLLHP